MNALNGKSVVHGTGNARLEVGTLRGSNGPMIVFAVSLGVAAGGQSWQRVISAYNGSGKEWEEPNWMVLRPGGAKPAAYEPQIFTIKHATGVALANVVVGGGSASKSQGLAGDIAEVLIFDRRLPEADEDAIMDYLTRKWSLK